MASKKRQPGRHRKVRAVAARPAKAAAPWHGETASAPRPRGIAATLRTRRTVIPVSATALTVAAGVGALAVFGSGSGPAPAKHTAHLTRKAALPAPGVTELASLRVAAPRYASPGVRASGAVPASWYGYPSVLPVIGTSPGWLQVRLAQRPDGSTAWIPAADATLSSTPYRIVINLSDTTLALYEHGRQVFSAPAGVGARTDPTPPGDYFVAFTEPPPQPNPGYGPFILVTSDHSKTISDWEGSDDAVIGIHGPLGASLAIGKTGAYISHGCIRLQPQDQLKLTGIPAGTPITITS
jgi:lipoprotein-anchoring transpeptidase ErfK/SrfK